MEGQRPIGWWVRRLDDLLDRVVDRAVATEGLTRRHWQALHELACGRGSEAALRRALAAFATPDKISVILAQLIDRGWLDRGPDGELDLTEAGLAAHDRLLAEVTRLRRQVTEGLSGEEYERALAALQRMVANVERTLTSSGA